jgi:uncharacterized protein (TIGR03086 family)
MHEHIIRYRGLGENDGGAGVDQSTAAAGTGRVGASAAELARLDAVTVRATVAVAVTVTAADLARSTPCAGWTLADLLAHMTVQHEGFAAAARGNGADLRHWQPRAFGTAEELVAAYAAAADQVIDAFAADGVADRAFDLPEISFPGPFPARQAIAFHLVDYVAHGWDLARSLGLGYDLEPAVLDAALLIARSVPAGEQRLQPGAAFAPRIETPATAPLAQILALLGRHPAWPQPS